jgi:hypothetical protein
MDMQNRGDLMNGCTLQGAEKVLVRESWYNGNVARHFRPCLQFLGLVVCIFAADPVFAATVKHQVRPPAGLMLSSSPDNDTGSNKVSRSAISEGTVVGSDDADALSRALKEAIATDPIPPFSAGGTSSSVITQEIRYEMPEAEEVYIGWGINGWKTVPQGLRPAGTKLHDGTMSTPMVHEGNSFVVKVQVQNGTVIDYGFWISKKRGGQIVGVWDANGYPPRNYQTIARPNHPAVVIATLDLETAQSNAQRTYVPLVTQKILYHANEAREVSLVWGINGWQTVSEDIRPLGTVMKEDRMHTPMVRKDDTFMAKIQVPAGTILDYNFLIAETNNSAKPQIWEAAKGFRQTVTLDGSIVVDAKAQSALQNTVPSESSENASGNSGVAQQFRYYLVHRGGIFLAAVLALALLVLLKVFVFSQKSRSQ